MAKGTYVGDDGRRIVRQSSEPKIEDLMYVMNQTRIEFTVPDEDDDGEGGKTGTHEETLNHLLEQWNERR